MKPVKQHIHGTLRLEANQVSLLLKDINPISLTVDSLFLRYGLTLLGVDEPIFPAFVLDDWGSEIKGLDLYDWIREFGDQFPRAELFGFSLAGRETQCFLREVELHARLLCFIYPSQETALSDGLLLQAIFLPDESVTSPTRVKRPPGISGPLRLARLEWWRTNLEAWATGPRID